MMDVKEATIALIMSSNTPLSARMLFVQKGASKLGEDKTVPPGGDVEPGETPEECVHREVKEETGLMIPIEDFMKVAILERYHGETHYMRVHVYRTYRAQLYSSQSGTHQTGTEPVDSIPYKRMFPLDNQWLPKAIVTRVPFRMKLEFSQNGRIGRRAVPLLY